MPQDDLKPYLTRPGEANIKADQPEKEEERHPTHFSKLEEQPLTKAQYQPRRNSQKRGEHKFRGRDYIIW